MIDYFYICRELNGYRIYVKEFKVKVKDSYSPYLNLWG